MPLQTIVEAFFICGGRAVRTPFLLVELAVVEVHGGGALIACL